MARYTKDENGNLILTAGGTRTWIVTQAAHDRAVSAGTAPNNCLVAITDDYDTSTVIAVPTLNSVINVNYSRVFTRNNVATVSVDTHQTSAVIPANTAILSGLPKPLRQIWFMVFADATTWHRGYIDTDGNFKLLNDYPSGGSLRGSVTYVYDEE